MASMLMHRGIVLVNALSFSGTEFLFSKFSDHGETERKHHDVGINHQRDIWNQQWTNTPDYINLELRKRKASHENISVVDEATSYYTVFARRVKALQIISKKVEIKHLC